MSKKKVLIFARHDWANSGYKLSQAINRHSEKYEAKYFSGMEHPFGYFRSGVLNTFTPDGKQYVNNKIAHELKSWVKDCSILHFKGDEGIYENITGVNIPVNDLPVIWNVCGTHWRNGYKDRWEKFGHMVNKVLANTPDLIFPEVGGDLIPFAVDTERYPRQTFTEDCFIIGHSPSTAGKKGTIVVAKAINRLIENNRNVFPNVQQNIPFPLTMTYKRLNHVFIDQITNLGVYGNSAVEAGVYGSAVIASHNTDCGYLAVHDEDSLYELLHQLFKNPKRLKEAQDKCYQHTVETHSYPAVCKKLEKYYDEVLS